MENKILIISVLYQLLYIIKKYDTGNGDVRFKYKYYIQTNYILDSLVMIESLVLSTRIKVDEFITRLLLKIVILSITQDADNRASAS